MMVRFATLCDVKAHCTGARSPEYTQWPSCWSCLSETCPDCAAPDSLTETDGESRETVLCVECAKCVVCESPSTRYNKKHADYDPYCDACFTRDFTVCQNCNRTVPVTDIGDMLVMPATRMDPAEYEEACAYCAPDEDDQDRRDWEAEEDYHRYGY